MKTFDERLFLLKIQPINQRMHGEAGKCWARARREVKRLGNRARLLPAFVECQLEVLRKYLEEVYRLRREVWVLDGNAVTPEFIRNMVVPHVFTVIAARKGAIQHELDLRATRAGDHQRGGHILVHQMNQLQGEVANQYEIEAIEISKKELQARKLTQAPSPPRAVGGLGITLPCAKPTQIPPDFPTYFPKELKARTAVILAEAVRKFQYQTQTLELCKHVISEMIPLFCEAVTNGTMKASMTLEEGLGGMGDLLRSLVVHNDDGPRTGWGLSDEAYRLQQEARKSDEWLRLAKAIVEADERRAHPTFVVAPHLDKLIACLAVEPADLWPEYGEAAPYVRQLAEIEWNKKIQWSMSDDAAESHRKRAELIQIIVREFPDAARKLSLPLVEPRDSNASVVKSKSTNGATDPFTHSEDYRTVTFRGKTHTLTSQQAQMIEILHRAHEIGNSDVSIALILEGLEKQGGRWQDTFKSNPEAKKALVKSGTRKGTLRLTL